MSRISTLLLKAAPAVAWNYLSWIRKAAKHPEKYPLEVRYKKLTEIVKKINRGLNLKIEVEGLENVPQEASLIISNHLSSYDPLIYLGILPHPTAFLAKKEVQAYPVVREATLAIDGLFLDREDIKKQLRTMMAIQEDLTQKRKHWLIFAEGTRNKDPLANLGEFHHGTFRPAYKAGAPIVPSAIYGSFRALKNKPHYKRYVINVKFMKPLYPDEYKKMTTEEIAKKVQAIIQKEVTFSLRKKNHQEMSETKDRKYNIYDII